MITLKTVSTISSMQLKVLVNSKCSISTNSHVFILSLIGQPKWQSSFGNLGYGGPSLV